MIIQDNKCTEIGDVLIFQTVIMVGIKRIDSYSDTVTGVTVNRAFDKKFRYSLDSGVTYSDWQELTDLNISNSLNLTGLQSEKYRIALQLRYERIGSDNTGELVVEDFNLAGEYAPIEYQYRIGARTIFSEFLEDHIETLNLTKNLCQKYFEYGIIPKSISRKDDTEGNPLTKDKDYTDYWQVIAHYFSLFFLKAMQFENIYWKRDLLCEYLKQNNIMICDCNDIIELQLIVQNFYDEIRQRGTEEVFHRKGYEYRIGYRYAYRMPVDFELRPSQPIQIDGIKYTEVSTLPFGWIVVGDRIIAPEKNFHEVKFYNEATGKIDLDPNSIITILPTKNSGIKKKYNGEYLRLICFNDCDEFIRNFVQPRYLGWWADKWSPLYRGLRAQKNDELVKGYEKTFQTRDLSKYPVFNSDRVFIGESVLPDGTVGTIMYISSDGEPCYPDIHPIFFTYSNYLTLIANFFNDNQVEGNITIINLQTLEEFDIPLNLIGTPFVQNTSEIESDLIPGNYRFAFNLSFTGKLIGLIRAGGLEINIEGTDGYVETIDVEEVHNPLLEVQLNFGLTN